MQDNNKSEPATKADLGKLAQTTKADLGKLAQTTKADLEKLAQTTKGDLMELKIELKGDLTELKNDLNGKIDRVHLEVIKLQSRVGNIEEKMVTRDDNNRIFNLLDSIAGDIKKYQRQDTLRGDAVMKHEERLNEHETRLQKLETK